MQTDVEHNRKNYFSVHLYYVDSRVDYVMHDTGYTGYFLDMLILMEWFQGAKLADCLLILLFRMMTKKKK